MCREHVHEDIKEVIKPFDWSYSTDYAGSTSPEPTFKHSEKPIPIALLTRPDPILFFDEVMLYEDELADNGIAMLSGKIRVMPERLLLLLRFFLRLDGVVCRIRDTRVFVEFKTGEVIREYTAREEKYDTIKSKLAYLKDEVPAMLRDPNKLSELMPVVERRLESLTLT
jgi:type 2A phosphatase activator TIP41